MNYESNQIETASEFEGKARAETNRSRQESLVNESNRNESKRNGSLLRLASSQIPATLGPFYGKRPYHAQRVPCNAQDPGKEASWRARRWLRAARGEVHDAGRSTLAHSEVRVHPISLLRLSLLTLLDSNFEGNSHGPGNSTPLNQDYA